MELTEATYTAVKALNKVLTEGLPLHPLQIQRDSVRLWRQIGLGTFGLGDMLIKMGITYGTSRSLSVIKDVFSIIAYAAIEQSLKLAKEHGSYPMCNNKALVNSSFIKNIVKDETLLEKIKKYGLFNSQLLTCAPTGSIATMVGASTGVEPNFAFSFNRRTVSLNQEETVYKVDTEIVKQYKKITGNTELPEYFVASQDINPFERIAVQAALQKYIDASISSTINLPESTTIQEVFDIYVEAWKQGLKGVTIWRDNCQRQGILTTDSKKESKEKPEVEISQEVSLNTDNAKLQLDNPHELKRGEIIKAGNECIGLKRTLITGCGSLHCTAYFDPSNGELRECYLSKGSTGGCNNFMISLSRMISLAARGGIKIENILDQLKSCGVCPSYAVRSATKKDTSKGSCCPVAVGEALKSMAAEMQDIVCKCNHEEETSSLNQSPEILPKKALSYDESKEKRNVQFTTAVECPNCHEPTLIHQGGCVSCTNCSYTRCE
jgi:ribonucleoside-diphosphate reductase alpha chain